MREYYILLSSVTMAMKGESALRKAGYKVTVLRDSTINPYGCGYVLRIYGNVDTAAEILKKNGVRIREIREVW